MQLFARAALICLLSFAVHASAENRVCIGGDLDHLSAIQTSACWDSAHQVHAEATRFGAPADWHFLVVCTESDWKTYATYSKRGAADLATIGADTNLQRHTTFLRGDWLSHAGTRGLSRIVAHEVAVALLQSRDEKIIQRQVAVWIPQSDEKSLTLQASR